VSAGLGGFLDEIAAASAARVSALLEARTQGALERAARRATPPLPLRVSLAGFELVAEVKFSSPAAGALAVPSADDALRRARLYAAGGAAAISVLTEPTRFAGALAHLAAVARAVRVPVLRKDFLVHPLQLLEARGAGASGVLLVVRLLDGAQLEALLDEARRLGLFVLLEAFDRADLARAARLVAERGPHGLCVGVNARDLATLEVDAARHGELAASLPCGVPAVAESGLASAEDARRVALDGYALALVGSALMRAPDPAARLSELLDAGRTAARERRRAR
jgi:indole-3-glycerol phosphate synthase